MSEKDERVANALRVLTGEPVRVRPARWWHAYGRVREFPRDDGKPADVAYQMTVVSPSDLPPDDPRVRAAAESWGDYLTSWDHEPSTREKEAVTPEEFRQSEEELALWDALDAATPGGADDEDDAW